MIQEFVTEIEAGINNFAEQTFNQLAAGLASALWLIAALVFVALMINVFTQAKEIGLLAYVGWFIRVAIIIAMASSWVTFQPIFNGVNGLADSISGAMTGGGNVWQTLDQIVDRCFMLATEAFESSTFGISITGGVLWVVGALIGAFGTGVALVAKGGLAVLLGLAPVAISTLMVSGTSQIFASWAKTVIGLVLVIVVLTGVVSLVSALFANEIGGVGSVSDMAGIGRFLAVCIISIVMLTQIPTLATGMAGAVIAASSGLAAASGLAGGLKNSLGAANDSIRGGVATAKTAGAMRDAAKDGNGFADKASRAMTARREIASLARNRDSTGRQGDAATKFRQGLERTRAAAHAREGGK